MVHRRAEMRNAAQATVGTGLEEATGTMPNFFGAHGGPDVARIREYPERQLELGFSSKFYSWVSDGAVGSVSHIALTPRPSELAVGLCDAAVTAREITRSVIPRHACLHCLQIYSEQRKRD
jgi:hypothetical protein